MTKEEKRDGTLQRLPVGCRSFMTFEDESLKEGEVMLQTLSCQPHVTVRGVKAESLGMLSGMISQLSRDYDLSIKKVRHTSRDLWEVYEYTSRGLYCQSRIGYTSILQGCHTNIVEDI